MRSQLTNMAYTSRLVPTHLARRQLVSPTFGNALYLPGDTNGFARLTSASGLAFDKLLPYAWGFWIKFSALDERTTIILRLDANGGGKGYRIVKEYYNSKHVICFQEGSSNFTSDRWEYPINELDKITEWHHIVITWSPASSTSCVRRCFLDGVPIYVTQTTQTWGNTVNAPSNTFDLGNDYNEQTIDGYLRDLVFYRKFLLIDEVFEIKNKRKFRNAVSLWTMDQESGPTITDSVGDNDLTLINNYTFGAY